MHADLIAIRAGLGQLQASGARIIDCHHLGLSGTEPLPKISSIADEWKQPFQKEYTERSVSQAFDKLLGLRTDVELALEKAIGKAGDLAPLQPAGKPAKPASTSKKSAATTAFSLCEWQGERTSCGAGTGRGGPGFLRRAGL